MNATIRPYDPATDRGALWVLKRGFELGLGEGTGTDDKRERYAAKLDDAYRRDYLEWVERCQAKQSGVMAVVTVPLESPEAGALQSNQHPNAQNELVVDDQAIVGYAFLLPERLAYIWDAAVLNEIFVLPAARGTGVADALMDHVLEVARGQSLPLDRLVLDVDRKNERARAFYDRYGFDHWGEIVARDL